MNLIHIGRANTNDVVINDPTVSRQHAQLIVNEDGQVTLVDLNSANGTFVNGQKLTMPRRLDQTDIVKLGEHLFPWRNYLQNASQSHTVQHSSTVIGASAPSDLGNDPIKKPFPVKAIAIGAIAVAIILIAVWLLFFQGGNGSGNLQGKWLAKENNSEWIKFDADGTYTEGFNATITFDSASYELKGENRIIIQRKDIKTTRHYSYAGSDLNITQGGKTTVYEPDKK